jgi:hypothetical protein
MTLVATSNGLYYPYPMPPILGTLGTGSTMAAASRRVGLSGHVYIEGRAASKTLSSSGGKIRWRAGSVTWANATTKLDVGVQGFSSSTTPASPDGSYTVKTTHTGGDGAITSNAVIVSTMTTGSATISHGDLIYIVLDMTARGGADSVVVPNFAGNAEFYARPGYQFFGGASWAASANCPLAIIEFDDGTLGAFASNPASWFGLMPTSSTTSYADATNPDENGMIFQVPWDCKIDALIARFTASAAAVDQNVVFYTDPLGTPSAAATFAVPGESLSSSAAIKLFTLASEISLTKNTDYCVAVKATGASNTALALYTLDSENYRKFLPGSTTLRKGSRNNSTGAFSAESPAVTMYQLGVRISQLSASGGGGAAILGGSVIR